MNQMHKKIKSDANGYFFSKIREINNNINKSFYTSIAYLLLSFKNIRIGEKCIFYGKPYFYRFPESKMTIGNDCIFDSSHFRNLIGVDKCCTISTLTKKAELYIGNSSGFSGVRIGCAEKITIGNDCLIGANVLITDTDWHPLDPSRRKEYLFSNNEISKPVKIGNNVFIGVNSILLKGTVIGDNSVIGAGSIVSGVIPPNVVAAGNPCRILKNLD